MSRIVLALLLVLSAVTVPAQNNTSPCEVTIHVRSNDRDFNGHVQVQVLSPSGTPVATVETNADGTATVTVMSGATYHVQITGEGIEPASYEFFIFGGDTSHTENFNVKRSSAPAKPPTAPTISLAEMNVPSKARDEMQKGSEAFDKGDMAKAQQHFEKAVAIYPQYARAYANLGIIAAKSGDRTKARAFFLKASEVDDKFLPAYVDLARIDIQEKNYRQAEATLGKVMAMNPAMSDALALLATAEYGNKDYDKALVDAQRVHLLGNDKPYANMHLLAGQILEMQNRTDEAAAEYKMFLKEDPSNSQAPAIKQAIADLEAKGSAANSN